MKLSLLILIPLLFFIFAQETEAKVLPQAKSKQKQVASKTTSIGVSARLRPDKKALIVYFSNLQNATNVSYMLRYKTNGQEEGAMGGLDLNKPNSTNELLFGTCSKNVCRYHSNITDARLEVSYTIKTGKKYLKRFKIRI